MSDSELIVANRGIWIPSAVWESKDLSIQEKALLAKIHGFKECFASNGYLADFLGLSVTRVKALIKSLDDKGYITRTEERQGQMTVKRTLHVVEAKYFGVIGHGPENGPTPARKQAHPQPENGHRSNTVLEVQNNNTASASSDAVGCPKCIEAGTIIADCWICAGTGKEEPKPTTTTDKPETDPQSKELFETQTKPEVPPTDKTINIPFDDWWAIYGKKIDRKKCERKWSRLSNKTRLAIMEHTPKYVRATPDAQYRKNPSTYLNSETWNDEQLPTPSQGWPNLSYPTNQNQTTVDVDAAMAPKAVRRQESTPEQLKRNQEQAANLLNIFKGD